MNRQPFINTYWTRDTCARALLVTLAPEAPFDANLSRGNIDSSEVSRFKGQPPPFCAIKITTSEIRSLALIATSMCIIRKIRGSFEIRIENVSLYNEISIWRQYDTKVWYFAFIISYYLCVQRNFKWIAQLQRYKYNLQIYIYI